VHNPIAGGQRFRSRLVPTCRHGDWNLVTWQSWRIGVAMRVFITY
jgi:hypothetical protein